MSSILHFEYFIASVLLILSVVIVALWLFSSLELENTLDANRKIKNKKQEQIFNKAIDFIKSRKDLIEKINDDEINDVYRKVANRDIVEFDKIIGAISKIDEISLTGSKELV